RLAGHVDADTVVRLPGGPRVDRLDVEGLGMLVRPVRVERVDDRLRGEVVVRGRRGRRPLERAAVPRVVACGPAGTEALYDDVEVEHHPDAHDEGAEGRPEAADLE